MIFSIRPLGKVVGQWKRSWRSLLRLTVGLMIIAVVVGATVGIWGPIVGHWLIAPPAVAHADAIVVLGGGYPERITHGIELYRQGLAPEIWLTGDVPGSDAAENDAREGVQLAEAQNVPGTALVTLPSTSTWEDGTAITRLAQQRKLHSLLIVTSWYHSRRALCVVKLQMSNTEITVYNDPVPFASDLPNRWWSAGVAYYVFSELLKNGYYWIRHGVNPWCN